MARILRGGSSHMVSSISQSPNRDWLVRASIARWVSPVSIRAR